MFYTISACKYSEFDVCLYLLDVLLQSCTCLLLTGASHCPLGGGGLLNKMYMGHVKNNEACLKSTSYAHLLVIVVF